MLDLVVLESAPTKTNTIKPIPVNAIVSKNPFDCLFGVLNPGAAGFFNNVKVWIVRKNSTMIHNCRGCNDAVAHGNMSVLTLKKTCAPCNFSPLDLGSAIHY